jgi:hypothetical protein
MILMIEDLPMPAMKRPTPTTATAMRALAAVSATSYRICCPTTEKPSMAMKCMLQMAVPPIAHAASINHQARWAVVCAARTRRAQVSPSSEPSTEMP